MGAWGVEPFENDDAGDWAHDLEEQGLALVEETLHEVLETSELDAGPAACALAACEVVACLRSGGATASVPEGLAQWLAANREPPTDQLIELATRALTRVLRDDSELSELWGDDAEWRSAVDRLRVRLDGPR